jgi:hypothetical protein
MAQVQPTRRFRWRLLGYDRRDVTVAMTAMQDELQRAVARRDELIATTTNVQRIGEEVAEMLRSLADRAAEIEEEAAAKAQVVLAHARADAQAIRAEAVAELAAVEARAEELREAARQRAVAVSGRRQTAISALHAAVDQIRQLTGSIEEIDLDADLRDEPQEDGDSLRDRESDAADTVVVVEPDERDAGSEAPAEDPIGPVLARINGWAGTTS